MCFLKLLHNVPNEFTNYADKAVSCHPRYDMAKRRGITVTCIGFADGRRCRLEAATSRLEDMVPSLGDGSASPNEISAGQPQYNDDHARGASPAVKHEVETLPPSIDDFDAMINGDVETYVNMSEEIGGLVAEQVRTFQENRGSRQLLILRQTVCCSA